MPRATFTVPADRPSPRRVAAGRRLVCVLLFRPCSWQLHWRATFTNQTTLRMHGGNRALSDSVAMAWSDCPTVRLSDCLTEASEAYTMTMSCRCERLRTNNPRPLAVCALGAPASVGLPTAWSVTCRVCRIQLYFEFDSHLRNRGRVCWQRGAFFA